MFVIHSWLQWGHDKIVMEVSGTGLRAVPRGAWLQWGHDKIVMEVECVAVKNDTSSSFNGAMTK